MPAPIDRAYATVTGQLATLLGVSIAAARRRVDQQAAREGTRETGGRVAIAERMIQESQGQPGLRANCWMHSWSPKTTRAASCSRTDRRFSAAPGFRDPQRDEEECSNTEPKRLRSSSAKTGRQAKQRWASSRRSSRSRMEAKAWRAPSR